jgi:hypothetical protein
MATLYIIKKPGNKFSLEDNLCDVYSDKQDAENRIEEGYVMEELSCPFVFTDMWASIHDCTGCGYCHT